MKDSIIYSQDATVVKNDECSEKKCPTCFLNKGCMYEPYSLASMFNLKKFYLESLEKTTNKQVNK